MRLALAALLAAIAMTACAKPNEEAALPPPPGEAGATAPAPDDQCNAAAYQILIGKKKAEIPEKPANATWRVTCSTCPVTMDFSATRLNIFYNEKTEVIEQVKCG